MKFLKENWKNITIGGLLLIILLLVRCQPKEEVVIEYKDRIVTLPEIVGDLTPDKIEELPSRGTDSIIYKDKVIYSTRPFDKKKVAEYLDAKTDSIRIAMYLEAKQEREYNTDLSDENVELKVWTKTIGEMVDLKAFYKVKERDIVIQEKIITKTVIEKGKRFALVGGGGYNHPLTEDVNANFEVIAGIRIGKVSLLGSANTERTVGGKILLEF